MSDDSVYNSEPGRFEIVDLNGKFCLLDTITGSVWLFRDLEKKTVLVKVSTATCAKEEKLG